VVIREDSAEDGNSLDGRSRREVRKLKKTKTLVHLQQTRTLHASKEKREEKELYVKYHGTPFRQAYVRKER